MTPKRAQLGNGSSANPFRASEHQFKARCSLEMIYKQARCAITCITAKCLNFHLEQVENSSGHVLPCNRRVVPPNGNKDPTFSAPLTFAKTCNFYSPRALLQ